MAKPSLFEHVHLKRSRRSRSLSHSSIDLENVEPIRRGRSPSIVESSNYTVIPQIQDDYRIVKVAPFGLVRPLTPKTVNVNINAEAHRHRAFRNVDQNVTESEPGDIPDEGVIADTMASVPSIARVPVPILRPSPPAILPWRIVIGPNALNDPVMYIQIHRGFHHVVWDPNICDGFVLWGQASYHHTSPSMTSPMQLPFKLSLEVHMAKPRNPARQTPPDYVCLMKTTTLINIDPSDSSTTTGKIINQVRAQQLSRYYEVEYPFPSLVPLHAPCDLEITDIERYPAVQTFFFKITLPVGDPILFRDRGSGDLSRFLKIKGKAFARVASNDVVSIRQLTNDVDLTVNVLKTTRFLDGL